MSAEDTRMLVAMAGSSLTTALLTSAVGWARKQFRTEDAVEQRVPMLEKTLQDERAARRALEASVQRDSQALEKTLLRLETKVDVMANDCQWLKAEVARLRDIRKGDGR